MSESIDTAEPIARDIWEMKYRFKDAAGRPVDATVEDTWRRVAGALAEPEKPSERENWARVFFSALEDHRFLPAGRILAGAGTGRSVTLFNCFVMGRLEDSMAGIFQGLKEAALTMQQGGGIGHDFSTLRPRGAPVKGVGADASGPLSFMDVWDAMCRTIMSAGSRRGAMMATMRCDHPDIEAFIDVKHDARRLRMFNLSVLATDAFMRAVRSDADWPLKFAGEVHRTVKARSLWDRIMRSTYEVAEPGVIFIDRINEKNNLSYCETIEATNPCVTGDTWVHTSDGPRQVLDLVGHPFRVRVNGKDHATGARGFFLIGRKHVLRLTTLEGHTLRLTADHRLRRVRQLTRFTRDDEWCAAADLHPGDRIVLNDLRACVSWAGNLNEDEGYLLGLLVCDGTLKTDKAVLSAWLPARVINGPDATAGIRSMMDAALRAAKTLPHRSDFAGWQAIAGRAEYRLALGALKHLAERIGMKPGRMWVTPVMERASSGFYCGFLRGLFDADGSVQGTQAKGVSVRLAQSDLDLLQSVQRMLLRLGIASTVYRERRRAGNVKLPNGRGGNSDYATKPQHELVISGENLQQFNELVGFADSEKATRLKAALSGYQRMLNRERFIASFGRIDSDGVDNVYDVEVPGINAFDANGLLAHNCGEQPLPPHGACLLGSLNLTRFVSSPFTPEVKLDTAALADTAATAVRMMDNVVDVSLFPLEEQRQEARNKRRIGLGMTGLADALVMCGLRYGSRAAAARAGEWMAAIETAAYLASIELAKAKGSFPLFDREAYLASGHVRDLPAELRTGIARSGIRNALLTSIAPTGTISLFAGNVSSGIEPIFALAYRRKVLQPDGSHREEPVEDYAVRLYRRLNGPDAALPEAFVTTAGLTPSEHLHMQAAVQAHVDSSISKTINVPQSMSFEDFKAVYAEAFDLGLKGCTTFRPNSVTGSVLSDADAPAAAEAEPALPLEAPSPPVAQRSETGAGVVYMRKPQERRGVLPGYTYKLRWPDSDHAIYITVNDLIEAGGRRRPFEVFINSKNMEHYAWTVALTRMISAVFRRGGDVAFVVEELKAVFDPRGGQWMEGRYVPSLLAAIGSVIEKHMIDTGFLKTSDIRETGARRIAVGEDGAAPGRQCPKCGEPSLVNQEGCDFCLSCGYSRCS